MKRATTLIRYSHYLVACLGAFLLTTSILGLFEFHEAATRYGKKIDPLVNRLLQTNPAPRDIDERTELLDILQRNTPPEYFKEHIDLINRILLANPAPRTMEERIELASDLNALQARMKHAPSPGVTKARFFLGLGFFALALWLSKKSARKEDRARSPSDASAPNIPSSPGKSGPSSRRPSET